MESFFFYTFDVSCKYSVSSYSLLPEILFDLLCVSSVFSGFCIISSHSKMVRSIPLIELPGIYGCPYGFFMHAMICIFPFSNCISPAFKVYAMHLCISSVEMRFRIAQCFRSSLVSFTMKRSSSASRCFFLQA